MNNTKICEKCNEEKSVMEFIKSNPSYCKECRRISYPVQKEESYCLVEKKKKHNIEQKKWRDANPEKMALRYKRRREKRALETKRKKIEKEVQRKKIKQEKEARREYKYQSEERRWAKSTRSSHKQKGFDVQVSLNELHDLANKVFLCTFCGKVLTYDRRIKTNSKASWDRINNENFLTLKNTQIICTQCNRMKSNITMDEYVKYCKKIAGKFGYNIYEEPLKEDEIRFNFKETD